VKCYTVQEDYERFVEQHTNQLSETNAQVNRTTSETELIKVQLDQENYKLLYRLSNFLSKHYSEKIVSAEDPSRRFISLKQLLEDLMNLTIENGFDPYLSLQPYHWTGHVDLLVSAGIVERHHLNENQIRIVPFHI
jgi:hypothetical protein